jgi:mono/diheme cytochrome c family protein
MISNVNRTAIGILACAALAGATACAKGREASADSAALASSPSLASSAADSAAMTPAAAPPTVATADSTTPAAAEKQTTAAATTPSQAKRLDEATRVVAREGAKTRDTARTGVVTPPPAVRKTATAASTASKSATTTSAAKSATTAPTTVSATTVQAPTTKSDTNPPTAAAQQTASAQDDHLTASPAAYQGWKTFHVYCYRCHGVDAMGSDLAPNLRHSVGPEGSVTHEVFVTTVKEGRLPKGMPSWKALLSDEQIENLWAYLQARSSGKLAAGRPRQAKSD